MTTQTHEAPSREPTPEEAEASTVVAEFREASHKRELLSWDKIDKAADVIVRQAAELRAMRARIGHLDVKRTTEAGAKDVWLHFEASDGKKAALSVSAIAHRQSGGGPSLIGRALNQWILDRHGEP